MTDTVISSASKEVVIGFNRPFVMIGERINPTGRKLLSKEMEDFYSDEVLKILIKNKGLKTSET